MERIDIPEGGNEKRPDDRQRNSNGRVFFGLVLVLAGAYWLFNRAGVIDFPNWLFQWPVILIALGVFNLVANRFQNIGGYILLLIGGYFYIDRNFDLPFNLSYYFWPLVLIIIGLAILLKPRSNRSKKFERWRAQHNDSRTTVMDSKEVHDESNYMQETVILGGVKKDYSSKSFQGGKLTCIMGGAEIYLGDSQIQNDVSIELNCVMGGAELTIPKEWRLKFTASTILGGISDERRLLPDLPADAPTLTITGAVILGGIEIKSV